MEPSDTLNRQSADEPAPRFATVTALNIYPVKSCRGIGLRDAVLQTTGLEHDRRWMAINENGRYLTQREAPRLASVVPRLLTNVLALEAPDMPMLQVPFATDGARLTVTVLFDKCEAIDAGPIAAEWLSRYLQRPARLVSFAADVTRALHPQLWSGELDSRIEFADGFPLLILSHASLDDLNTRLDQPLPMNRFRPNLVLDGLGPYEEDLVHELTDDDLCLQMARPCTRCKITTTDQQTGEVGSAEPLTTLKSYRFSKQLRGVTFGQYAVVAGGQGTHLRVGQRLRIRWK